MTLVIGCGTGRCGTRSLAALLDAQPGSAVTHESRPLLRWRASVAHVEAKVADLMGRGAHIVGDVCSSWLPHVPIVFRLVPSVRVVCLRRDRDETITSWLQKTSGGEDHWSSAPRRRRSAWDGMFPRYPTRSKEDAIAMYVDDYHVHADELAKRYCGQFRIVDVGDLNSTAGVEALLAYVGVNEPIVRVGLHLNRSHVAA